MTTEEIVVYGCFSLVIASIVGFYAGRLLRRICHARI